MSEEQFTMDMRKFLKQFGVGAQRAIEEAVRNGMAAGTIHGNTVEVRAVLKIEGVDEEFVVEETIHLPIEEK